jgi:hypothetical protein
MALNYYDHICNEFDCFNLYLIKTNESQCRNYPNTRRFNLKIKNTGVVEIIISPNPQADEPHLVVKDRNIPQQNQIKHCVEVRTKKDHNSGEWRFIPFTGGLISLNIIYDPITSTNVDTSKLFIFEAVSSVNDPIDILENAFFRIGRGSGNFTDQFGMHLVELSYSPHTDSGFNYFDDKIIIKLQSVNGQQDTYDATWNYDSSLIHFTDDLCDCTIFNRFKLQQCPHAGENLFRILLVGCSGEYLFVNAGRQLAAYPSNFILGTSANQNKEACFRIYKSGEALSPYALP